jgi:hypothetical protein
VELFWMIRVSKFAIYLEIRGWETRGNSGENLEKFPAKSKPAKNFNHTNLTNNSNPHYKYAFLQFP